MLKWGSGELLTPAFRRAYAEILYLLEWEPDEHVEKIPKECMDFLEKNKDPNYVLPYEVEDNLDTILAHISWCGYLVLEMFYRYFWNTEEEKEDYDRNAKYIERRVFMFIQMRVHEYLEDYEKDGTPFRGIEHSTLRNYPTGCAQALAVLELLNGDYVQYIPKKYLWILEMFKRKGYIYKFELEDYEDTCEKEPMEFETLEILADISYRYWKSFQVTPEELAVKRPMISWE